VACQLIMKVHPLLAQAYSEESSQVAQQQLWEP
jgi:hypothetical protein